MFLLQLRRRRLAHKRLLTALGSSVLTKTALASANTRDSAGPSLGSTEKKRSSTVDLRRSLPSAAWISNPSWEPSGIFSR